MWDDRIHTLQAFSTPLQETSNYTVLYPYTFDAVWVGYGNAPFDVRHSTRPPWIQGLSNMPLSYQSNNQSIKNHTHSRTHGHTHTHTHTSLRAAFARNNAGRHMNWLTAKIPVITRPSGQRCVLKHFWAYPLIQMGEMRGGNLSTAIATFGGRYVRELF